MKLFLDSADTALIAKFAKTGFVDGVTTNPSLIAKSGRDFKEAVAEIAAMVAGPISAQATAETAEKMAAQGRELAAIAGNVMVKLPMTWEGLAACRMLTADGIRTNITLCFSAPQALMAAKAGASFVSPFIGRIDDSGADGLELIAEIREVFDAMGAETEILAASVRGATHVKESARLGADAATLPPAVFEAMLAHPLTELGLAKFKADWANAAKDVY